MRILLIRHGADTGDPTADRPLTAQGRGQVAAVADWLTSYGATELRSSRETRARAGAEMLADRLGLPVVVDGRLDEIATPSEHVLPPPRERLGTAVPAGAESWAEFLDRVSSLISELCLNPGARRVVLMTHSGVFDAVGELLFGGNSRVELAVGHSAMTEWEYRPEAAAGRWLLRGHNLTPHLRDSG